MKRISFIPFAVAATLLLAGCSANELFSPDSSDNNHIRFSTELPATRAAAYEETGINAYTTMGVYAAHSAGNFNIASTPVTLLVNQKVERQSDKDSWYYSPPGMWNGTDKHSFFAYAPYNAPGLTTPLASVTGRPSIHFTVPANPANQVDLLLAKAEYNMTDMHNNTVQLGMRHVLTRVLFSARILHPYAVGVTSQIKQIELTGLKNQGTHTMDADEFWTGQSIGGSANSNRYTLSSATGGLLAKDLLHNSLAEVSTDQGNLYLMPQVLTDDSPEIKITVTTVDGLVTTDKDYTFSLISLLNEFKQGETLRFLLTVPNAASPEPFEIVVQHGDWNADTVIDTEIEHDPVLYISNETVYAYDGAVTCVYFSSNIAPNSSGPTPDFNDVIYIEDEGRISSNTGPTFRVADEFYAIAQHDPDRQNIKVDYPGPHINNLRYEKEGNFYRGHLDIVQRKTSSAGETSNQGKLPLILKLHVGKLVRDITVQRVVTTEAAKMNPTRYVGTFHRHHETGERLVTWYEPETTTWRVEKDNTIGSQTDRDALQLDTRISPDFRNKQLYSLVARNPEGTRVEQNDNLFGRGRVYFRVGWNTPTDGVKNRYARVKVTLWHHDQNGNSTESEHYLYCRQGDTEEQISTAESQYALYNVALPSEFARYPTQTGMLYQWNRLVPWSPLGDAAPYGWNSTPSDYETSFSYERNACPDGYVYPSTDQFDEMKIVFGSGGTAKSRGYYADGYFDRRAITYNGVGSNQKDEHRVNASNIGVASIGTILFNPNASDPHGRAARSIFLVSGGYRNGVDPAFGASGQLVANEDHGSDHGVHGGYWFDMSNAINSSEAAGASIFKGTDASYIKNYSKLNAHSLRCTRVKSWLFVFDTNGGENGPHSMTVPGTVGTINIPNTKPVNYYRTGYSFRGWTTTKDGTGTLYAAGQTGVATTTFGGATNPSHRVDFYAKWAVVIDFRTVANLPSNYLYDISGSTNDPYVTFDIQTNNGEAFDNASSETVALTYFSALSKAYPVLEFSEMQSAADLITADQACKAMLPINTWRLPRAQEVILVQKYTPRADELLGAKNSGVWTGTTSKIPDQYLYSYREQAGYYTLSSLPTTTRPYRCVRAAP